MLSQEDSLKLENQICFPLYVASRLLTRAYQPLLDDLGITYPQYLVLLLLWEKENLYVNEIGQLLFLDTNTLTPLLKRMEKNGLILRKRSEKDERKVTVGLTEEGKELKEKALCVPQMIFEKMALEGNEAKYFKQQLEHFIKTLTSEDFKEK